VVVVVMGLEMRAAAVAGHGRCLECAPLAVAKVLLLLLLLLLLLVPELDRLRWFLLDWTARGGWCALVVHGLRHVRERGARVETVLVDAVPASTAAGAVGQLDLALLQDLREQPFAELAVVDEVLQVERYLGRGQFRYVVPVLELPELRFFGGHRQLLLADLVVLRLMGVWLRRRVVHLW